MKVGEICNRDVAVVGRRESLFEAARRMRDSHVGSLVVVDEEEKGLVPVGILTDRDILVLVLSEGISLKGIAVEDIMSANLVTAREEDGLFETVQQMRRKAVRRIPIVDSKQTLVGILSLDDLLAVLARELKNITAIFSLGQENEALTRP